MIGQMETKQRLRALSSIPRAITILGSYGSGRSTLAAFIAKDLLQAPLARVGNKVDDIRELIEEAYKQPSNIVYLLSDLGMASIGAQNALLKVIEEPPNNAYFIITVSSDEEIPSTILSRTFKVRMMPYLPHELRDYARLRNPDIAQDTLEELIRYATNPRDIDLLLSYDIKEFIEYVIRVQRSLHKASIPNMLNISERVQTKQEGEGWDLAIFLEAILAIQMQYSIRNIRKDMLKEFVITTRKIREARRKGANKQYIIDTWLLEMRECRRLNQN